LVRDRLAQPPGELLAPRLLLGDPHALGEAVLLIPRLGVGDQPTERAERFGEGRTFHAPRRAHREPPEGGHHGPVILPLRPDRDLPPDDRRRRHHGAHGDEVRRALDPVGDIRHPGRQRGG
jgi:hypothetical protein